MLLRSVGSLFGGGGWGVGGGVGGKNLASSSNVARIKELEVRGISILEKLYFYCMYDLSCRVRFQVNVKAARIE